MWTRCVGVDDRHIRSGHMMWCVGGMWVCGGALWFVVVGCGCMAVESRGAIEVGAHPTEGVGSWYATWECCTKRGIAWSVDGELGEEGEGGFEGEEDWA